MGETFGAKPLGLSLRMEDQVESVAENVSRERIKGASFFDSAVDGTRKVFFPALNSYLKYYVLINYFFALPNINTKP